VEPPRPDVPRAPPGGPGSPQCRARRGQPQLTPAQIGDGSIDGLQFPDPTEGLAMVEPPAGPGSMSPTVNAASPAANSGKGTPPTVRKAPKPLPKPPQGGNTAKGSI